MKRVTLYILLPVIVLLACNKEKNVFSKSADQRITDTLTAYQARLTGSSYGWIGMVYPKGGGSYRFYFSFGTNGRVNMVSDFDSTSATVLNESSYRLESLQQPCLNFDTYNYIHLLADPTGSVNGGLDGEGLQSDFEFILSDSSTADTIRLTGRFNGSKALLWKATQAERDAYSSGGLESSRAAFALGNILYYFKRLTTPNGQYDIIFKNNPRTVTFQQKDGTGAIHTFTTAWYYTLNGIALVTPFPDGSQFIQDFTGASWNGIKISATAGGNAVSIQGTNTPLAVDPGAATAWYQAAASSGGNWYSIQGFHINGVDNAYRVDTLTGRDTSNRLLSYYYMAYVPNINPGIDFFGPIFLNYTNDGVYLDWGWGGDLSVKTDGHAVLNIGYTLGTPPTAGGGYLSEQRAGDPGGYYFVNTGPTTYDMVNKTDARIWISWTLAQ